MSTAVHPEPNSTEMEDDLRQVHTDHSGVAPGEIAIGVIIGRASEYFDFFVYGIASVMVFPAVFFPHEARL
ncbi:MAG: arabinose transporter permease, partial [Rhodoferax sp.]|nr:arabinose transporter permease [Rhodoferax sp.]